MSSQHLISSDYSSCISQIYILICSFIALRNSSSLHSYFEFTCYYRVSESSYTYKHTGRCIETFLCYFHNTFEQLIDAFISVLILYHYDSQQKLQMKTNVSETVYADILSQQ